MQLCQNYFVRRSLKLFFFWSRNSCFACKLVILSSHTYTIVGLLWTTKLETFHANYANYRDAMFVKNYSRISRVCCTDNMDFFFIFFSSLDSFHAHFVRILFYSQYRRAWISWMVTRSPSNSRLSNRSWLLDERDAFNSSLCRWHSSRLRLSGPAKVPQTRDFITIHYLIDHSTNSNKNILVLHHFEYNCYYFLYRLSKRYSSCYASLTTCTAATKLLRNSYRSFARLKTISMPRMASLSRW